MNTTRSSPERVAALFPLGDITATRSVLDRIPRPDLFTALQDHVSGQAEGPADYCNQIERKSSEIQSVHHSAGGERFFVKTWTKESRTLVWVTEDEDQLRDLKLLS